MTNDLPLERALVALGDLLAADGQGARLIAVGGAALRLDQAGEMEHPEPLSPAVVRAAAAVARDLGLPPDWLNTEIAAQWRTGLPPGLGEDLAWLRFGGPPGGLDRGLLSRQTLVALKLFAAVDWGPASVHFQDLRALAPTRVELDAAAAWVRTQDASPIFADMVGQVVDWALASDE